MTAKFRPLIESTTTTTNPAMQRPHFHIRLLALVSLTSLALSLIRDTCVANDLIWIEGEQANSHTMRQHGWYNSVRKTELSGGDWLSHFASGEMPVAKYDFTVPVAGNYEFWLRANPTAAAISVRWNGGDWERVAWKTMEQNINIASDGKPDLRFVAWVKVGKVLLRAEANILEVRFESNNNRHGGLDCFVLSREPFLPQGNRRPGQKLGHADEGMWAFEPDRDSFSPDSLLDLTYLNEKPAGHHGRVRRSADGGDFVDGTGQPIRFWAVNTTLQYRDDLAVLEEHARWLAKRGVNMVRHHGHLAPGANSRLTDVNQKDIDAAWRLVSAMKKQGIYVTLSPYWAVSVKPQPAWGLKSTGGENLTGLLFFDQQLQNAYKQWLRALLVPPNPHTGIPLAQDPAVALFQIQNEDSLLFWTESSIGGQQRTALAKRFGDWLVNKYGSLDRATDAWGGRAAVSGDDFSKQQVMPQKIWHLTQSQTGAMAARLNDQLQFYTQVMYDFNKEIARFLKEEIGYQGLINAGNWRTADSAKLLDAERYAYTANDVIGINRYYNGGQHSNPNDRNKAGYLISEGDTFLSESALKRPWDFPLALRQVQGHPMIVSESAWVPPLRYQTEGPFLVAAYSGLTGVDIFYWFSQGDIGFGPPMGKWQLSTPAQLGMFPAAAVMFRRGYVAKGNPALVEHRTRESVWARQAPRLVEEAGFDPNRDIVPTTTRSPRSAEPSLSPLAYLVGSVEVSFNPGETKFVRMTDFVDATEKVVRSETGQLSWNFEAGVCTLDAPKAKAIAGNLAAAGAVQLGSWTILGRNDYGTVMAVSLDDAPLSSSTQTLIQIGTVARPYGWRTTADKQGLRRIVDRGGSPWNIERADIEIQIADTKFTKAIQLDANGLAMKDVPLERTLTGIRFQLPPDALYVLMQ